MISLLMGVAYTPNQAMQQTAGRVGFLEFIPPRARQATEPESFGD